MINKILSEIIQSQNITCSPSINLFYGEWFSSFFNVFLVFLSYLYELSFRKSSSQPAVTAFPIPCSIHSMTQRGSPININAAAMIYSQSSCLIICKWTEQQLIPLFISPPLSIFCLLFCTLLADNCLLYGKPRRDSRLLKYFKEASLSFFFLICTPKLILLVVFYLVLFCFSPF